VWYLDALAIVDVSPLIIAFAIYVDHVFFGGQVPITLSIESAFMELSYFLC
jgi:hypothetical protein